MIHAGGDNHSDQPAKLGGGGARIVWRDRLNHDLSDSHFLMRQEV